MPRSFLALFPSGSVPGASDDESTMSFLSAPVEIAQHSGVLTYSPTSLKAEEPLARAAIQPSVSPIARSRSPPSRDLTMAPVPEG